MAYRQRGEGSFTHLVPQDCRTCKKSKNCKLKNQTGSHCSMRDRVERWVYQYYVRDIANKPVRKSISAKTRKLLLAKVNNLKEKPQETVGTLGAWMAVWLEKVIKGSVKTSTYAYYKYMLKYVPEDVRQKPLKSLTLELFADLFQKLYATGSLKDGSALSTTTVRGVRNTLKSCLEVAVKQNLIPFNPVRETRPLRSITKDIVVLSQEEAKRLQSVADNVLYRTNSRRKDKGEAYLVRQWAVLIRLLLATGVRRSEAFGLQWENVDFTINCIKICKSLYKGTFLYSFAVLGCAAKINMLAAYCSSAIILVPCKYDWVEINLVGIGCLHHYNHNLFDRVDFDYGGNLIKKELVEFKKVIWYCYKLFLRLGHYRTVGVFIYGQ